MFYCYILKSLKDHRLYIGSTNNLKKRLKEHNLAMVISTRYRTPFVLRYYEAFSSEKEARIREKQLKLFSNAWRQLYRRIKESLE